MTFPKNFLWGAATSAYQIEGAVHQDGRTQSVWDEFSQRAGAVFQHQSGDPACDHYNRFADDVGLMKAIGLRAYRFSIAWPRVQPDGSGAINDRGLAFYDRLVDSLLAAGIEPWVTLYHWDMPLWVHHRGGLLNREFVGWFADYSAAVVDRLSDRVQRWMTINEPQVFCKFGYGDGTNAPGMKLSLSEQLQTVHISLMAHGRACQVIRARAKTKPTVGWALVGRTDVPVSESARDIEAARQSTLGVTTPDLWNNTLYADPAILGQYPEDALRVYSPAKPVIQPGDLELIKQPLDYYGLNIYDGRQVRAGADGRAEVVPFGLGHPQTLFKWFVVPSALRWGPRFIHERYRLPVYITENGISCPDWVHTDGKVHDPQRIDYTRRYLIELRRAIADGADIRGYFHWSLMDNFEWAEGYQQRFGLIHVDIPTGTRTLKDSAHWYGEVIKSNGASL